MPARRQREKAERTQPGEGGGDGQVVDAYQLRQVVEAMENGVGFLATDHRARHDGALCAQGQAHEAAAAEALQLVALLVELLDAFRALWEHGDDVVLGEQALAVLRAGAYGADSIHGHADERQIEAEVLCEPASIATRRMGESEGLANHQAVERQGARMVGDDHGPTLAWHVLDRSEEHTSELQSQSNLVCRLLL